MPIERSDTKLLRQLGLPPGEPFTEVLDNAARRREARAEQPPSAELLTRVREVQQLFASLPELDTRPAEEILGYDRYGLPS